MNQASGGVKGGVFEFYPVGVGSGSGGWDGGVGDTGLLALVEVEVADVGGLAGKVGLQVCFTGVAQSSACCGTLTVRGVVGR